MKLKLYFLLFAILLLACNAKEKEVQLPADIKKVAFIGYNGFLPEYTIENDSVIVDPLYDDVIELIEFEKDFTMNITAKLQHNGNYLIGRSETPNWIKEAVTKTINTFKSDSIGEIYADIYDGYLYYMLIEKENETTVFLSGYPRPISPELNKISFLLHDSIKTLANKNIHNQDSIRNYIKQYKKYYSTSATAICPERILKQQHIRFTPPGID